LDSVFPQRNMRAAEPRQRHLRELGVPVLFGAAVLFLSGTLLLGANITAMQEDLASIEHTQQVLRQISVLESSLTGEELTVRSYALTGDPRFLRYRKNERRHAQQAIAELGRLSVSGADEAIHYQRIRAAAGRHAALFDSLSGKGPERAGEVARAILDEDLRAVVRSPITELKAFRACEVRRLGNRQEALTAQLSHAFLLAIGIILAAFLLAGIGLMAARIRLPAIGERQRI
jgi:CHASE3 domain sensor protein